MQLVASGSSGRDLGHLTYCTNIHAGEPLDEVLSSLARHLPDIKARVAGTRPMGVGLRLGHAATTSLLEPGRLQALQALMADGGYYVFTLNGFPYGSFHGQAVKEAAYRPDWSDPLRLSYYSPPENLPRFRLSLTELSILSDFSSRSDRF